MDVEPRSALHLTRNSLPYGSLPPLRSKNTPSVVPTNRQITRNAARRKRSTEQSFLTEQVNVNHQQSKGILQQRSNSATQNESIPVLSTKPNKPTDAPTPLITSSAGAARKISKVKHFRTSATITSTLGKSAKGHRNSAAKAARKGNRPSIPKPPPPIFDVTHTDVVPNTATYTSPYLSIYSLDDLSRWDMDSIPSIPSPPSSPRNGSSFGSTLFSTPIDDDDIFENEIPFPLSRQTKVLENMGVKKSKNKARANIETTLGRHVILPRDNSSPTPPNQPLKLSVLPGLPHPLPLRNISDNTETPHLLSRTTPPVAPPQPTPSPQPTSGPSASKKDAWGCMHLGAADCEFSIVFPSTAHYEVWDMSDDSHFACPALLCLMAKDAYTWSGMPLALPDVTLIDVRCEDIPLPSRKSIYDPNDEYSTQYTGGKTGTANDDLNTTVETRIGQRGISIEGKWIRTYAKPGVEGSGRSRVDRRGDVSNVNTHAQRQNYDAATMAMGGAYARGWYLKIWIPIPTRLFVKRETRMFDINARIFMMGDETRVLSLDGNGDGTAYPLLADAQMTVSHLRSRREMDGCWW
ncbi:hypothetical protein M413DRAFT_447945 [Hebeloma cylindrosporum]|uniref:Uncharacterized protein n=1 Tax=Hebeloma cylindrosporum TaxID=76867 RepID=A0A0C3C3N5_HEBCY|nr:hypothetical protein M413DRAFT_447945 [Hebeloma cylindrosporum h7]